MSPSSDIVPQQDFLGMYKPNHPCGGLEQHIVATDPTPELLANHDDHHTDTMHRHASPNTDTADTAQNMDLQARTTAWHTPPLP